MEVALNLGVDDIKADEETYEIVTAPDLFEKSRTTFNDLGWKYLIAEITMLPQNYINLTGKEAEQILKLMNALEDSEDVQNVYANFDIPDEEIKG